MSALTVWNGKELDLIRRTVAKDCNPPEFDMFMHICKNVRLDPLRRQIYAFVFGKDGTDKRKMAIVTGIDGYRTIAARTGNYRPDNRAPRIVYDEAVRNAQTNPLGIVKAEVSAFKFAHGEWFEVVGESYWDEFAPLKERWENDKPTGVFYLDPKKDNWRKMARVMICKCAEAQALRRAWPDDFSGLEVEEEVARAHTIDLTASEHADQSAQESKLMMIGGKDAITVQWEMNGRLERIPLGKFADAFLSWANHAERTSTEVKIWWHQNLPARQEFKAKAGHDYLELQKAYEARLAALEKLEVTQEAAE